MSVHRQEIVAVILSKLKNLRHILDSPRKCSFNVPIGEWEKIPRLQAKTLVCPEGAGCYLFGGGCDDWIYPVERVSRPKPTGFRR